MLCPARSGSICEYEPHKAISILAYMPGTDCLARKSAAKHISFVGLLVVIRERATDGARTILRVHHRVVHNLAPKRLNVFAMRARNDDASLDKFEFHLTSKHFTEANVTGLFRFDTAAALAPLNAPRMMLSELRLTVNFARLA